MIKDIYLAGGCFWGAEHFFRQIGGVVLTEVGFANGHTPDPTYKEVYTDTTGYAETVHIRYDTGRVGLKFLLRMFFKAIDPTSLNKQGKMREPAIVRASTIPIRTTCRPSVTFTTRWSADIQHPWSWKSGRCRTFIAPKNTTRTTWTRIPTATATCRSNSSGSPAMPRPNATDQNTYRRPAPRQTSNRLYRNEL